MSKEKLFYRRFEGEMQHRYGSRLLHCLHVAKDEIPMVMVGNPEQIVRLSE